MGVFIAVILKHNQCTMASVGFSLFQYQSIHTNALILHIFHQTMSLSFTNVKLDIRTLYCVQIWQILKNFNGLKLWILVFMAKISLKI